MTPSNMEAQHFPEAFLQMAIELLIHKGVLKQDDLGDVEVIEAALRNNRQITAQCGFTRSYREDFVLTAMGCFQRGQPEVAIMLVATANEHAINQFLASVIMRTTPEWEATSQRILSLTNPKKITDCLPLAGAALPKHLAGDIFKIAALRNKIVHARDRMILIDSLGIGFPSIDVDVSAYSFQKLLETHEELVNFLDAALDARYPAHRAARDAAQKLLERIQTQVAIQEEQGG